MAALQRTLVVLVCVLFVSGCYEDEAEVTINADGSGVLKQRLVLSRRLIVASSDGGGSEDAPPASKEEVLEKIGSAVNVTSFKQDELAGGGRVFEFEGTFSKPEQFFLSEFCRDTLNLRIASSGEGKAAIYCDMEGPGNVGPGLTQLYGLAKGLYVSRTVHLPTNIEKTNGHRNEDKNTVKWIMDLRDEQGLARTKEFIEGPDEGKGYAIFDASNLKFALPLKATALPKEAGEQENLQKKPVGLASKVVWVSVMKTKRFDGSEPTQRQSYVEIGLELSWNEDYHPVRYEKPVLLALSDDTGNDLVADEQMSVYGGNIYDHEKNKEIKLRAKAPSEKARKLKNMEGYVEVVSNAVEKKVVLENIKELAGKETTGNPVLDKLNFKIIDIQSNRLKIQIDGGNKTITSLAMLKDDGSKVKKTGGMGWGDEYSYDFDESISGLNRCEMEVVVEESMVKVPFSFEAVPLP